LTIRRDCGRPSAGRLDLTLEATVLIPRWRALFTEQELATARERLLAYEFDIDVFLGDSTGAFAKIRQEET
jgi:hypothetical protein